jgi:tRNA pseudouridine55 synthase
LTSLRRVATGGFDVARCVTLAAFEAMDQAQRLACLLPVQALAAGHARVVLDEQEAGRFLSGLRRRGAWADAQEAAVFAPPPAKPRHPHALTQEAEGQQPLVFLGTAHIHAGELIPERLLNPLEIQQILSTPITA